MTRIFGILIAVLFLSVGHTASAQYSDDLLKRAQNGDAEAQFNLGLAYVFGDGVSQDIVEAVKWWRLSAEQGDARSQYNLGITDYAGGDYAGALRWFRLAAEQGIADAQYNIGAFYYDGIAVAQDYVEAVKWYRLAAEQGNTDALIALGQAYNNGQGVLQDFVYAHMWFNIAASLEALMGSNARLSVSLKMTPEQIAEAQKLARECVRKAYKNC